MLNLSIATEISKGAYGENGQNYMNGEEDDILKEVNKMKIFKTL